MLSKRAIFIAGVVVFLFFFAFNPLHAADTTEQIIKQIDEILKENPAKPGEKIQRIKVAEDDTATLLVLTLAEGAEVKAHLHKTHDETIYVVRGTGRMLVNNKWVDIKPGTLHFNPMGKVHHTINTGNETAVVISIYTPAMKQPDFDFVK